ncbi:anaphase-promoting complex subunit 5 [Condylostylus longicornis]|uniref:anaphase-promoting complex subunit 5 n=1 Tax=Condylostylus longicornis TaxID=2530218 RepID=UPI00244DF55E|nr:anaphase-promoting complex subunit 5 [Condylostylus longicornis]
MVLDSHTKRELEILNPDSSKPPLGRIDVLTPHKIAVVLLVQQYLKVKQSVAENAGSDGKGSLSPHTRRRFCMLLLKLIQFPDMSYKELHNMLTSAKYKIDPIQLEGFEKCMSELNILGIENLLDLFDMQSVMDKLLSEGTSATHVNQFAIVGLYIRRIIAILEKLTFAEMKALYKSISLYYEKGIRALAISGADSNIESQTDLNISDEILDTNMVHRDRNSHSKWSYKQAELFIAQQCLLLENNELRALSPIDLHSKLNEIIQDNPLFSQAYFLSYMNYLRLHDYFSSLDALYRTFDRNPVQNNNTPDQRGFEYSSLNLAIMHASFDHKTEALKSLKECIMLAQEYGDKQCLDLANAWYCILNSENIDPLDKCLPDQNDLGMIELLTLSIQFVVKVAANCGYRPSDLFQMLLKSDKINCRNSLIEYIGSSLAIRSALWTLYGKNEIASICSQLLLKLKKTWIFGDYGNSESVCKVLCSLALWLSEQGEYNLSAVVLHHTKERFPRTPLANNWMLCDNYITITQCVHRCLWQEGMTACCQLYIFDNKLSILQRASIYITKRNVAIARLILDKLLEDQNLDSLTKVRASILLAYSMINPDGISAQTIDILGEASKISKDEYLEYEAAIIDMMFAYILLENGMSQKAFCTIRNCMEVILANGGIYDKAKTYFVFIKCLVASAATIEEKIQNINDSMSIIQTIIKYFKKLENHTKILDVYSYLAHTFHSLNLIPERNKYACKFRQYQNECNIPAEYLNVFF